MRTFDYFYGLRLGILLLKHSDNLSAPLQTKDLYAGEAQTAAKHTVAALKKMRTDEKCHLFWEDITQKATKFSHYQIHQKNEKMATYVNRSRILHSFRVGDKVWLSTKNLSLEPGSGSRKLNQKFCGPFRILEKMTDVTYRLEISKLRKIRKINDAFIRVY